MKIIVIVLIIIIAIVVLMCGDNENMTSLEANTTVANAFNNGTINVSNISTSQNISAGGTLTVNGATTLRGNTTTQGLTTSSITNTGAFTGDSMIINNAITGKNDLFINGDIYVGGNIYMNPADNACSNWCKSKQDGTERSVGSISFGDIAIRQWGVGTNVKDNLVPAGVNMAHAGFYRIADSAALFLSRGTDGQSFSYGWNGLAAGWGASTTSNNANLRQFRKNP